MHATIEVAGEAGCDGASAVELTVARACSMRIDEMQARALEVRQQFAEFERATYGEEWSTNDLVLGLVKDVGDLAEIAQRAQGKRPARSTDAFADLEHELGDCLWSLLVIADRFGIDVESAFSLTMENVSSWIEAQQEG